MSIAVVVWCKPCTVLLGLNIGVLGLKSAQGISVCASFSLLCCALGAEISRPAVQTFEIRSYIRHT
jgi:hypothetical protein